MTGYQRYKRNVFAKAILIPLIITLIFSAVMVFVLPHLQEKLPDGTQYSMQNEGEQIQ